MRVARIRVGGAAAEHLFSVACGLDSMAVGEDQIVAQIKAAARAAAAAGTTGPVVTGLIDAALRASKRARTQTTISTEGISLARAGLDLAAARLGGLAARDAVVLGTGSMGKLAARLLREAGVARLSVASRDAERAAEVAAAVGGHARCGPPTCPPRWPTPTSWSPPPGPPRPSWRAGPVPAARAQGRRPAAVRARPGHAARRRARRRASWPGSRSPTSPHSAGTWPTGRRRTRSPRSAPSSPPRPPRTPTGRTRRRRRRSSPRCTRRSRQLADAELARLHDRLPDLSERAAGRDGGHRPPHPPQGPAPADRPGQGVLHRPRRAGLPRRACDSSSTSAHGRGRGTCSHTRHARTASPAAAGHPRQSARAGPGRPDRPAAA